MKSSTTALLRPRAEAAVADPACSEGRRSVSGAEGMHIVDLTMFWAPASGGVQTYLRAKGEWLSRQPGVRHTLLVPGPQAVCDAGICALPASRIPFGQGYRFPLRGQPWFEKLMAIGPDLIEVADPYVLPWAALRVGRELGIPVVGFFHSDMSRLVSDRAGAWTERWLERYLGSLYRRFDRVLAPSAVMSGKLRRLGVEQAVAQPLGVDAGTFHPGRRDPALRSELGLDERTHLLVFAGRASREKNIPVLLRALEKLGPGFHLHLAGAHMPARLPDNVSRAAGFVDRNGLARLLASADALVHAGHRETFGLVVLEAMASGIPVVGVNSGAVPELVVPGTGLLAQTHSADAVVHAIRALFSDDHRAMGRLARSHVEARYDWSRVLPGLLGHYEELVYGQPAWPGVVNG